MDQLKATPYERTEVRQRYSNGHRPRTLTRGGQVVLAMPRTRDGSFSADLFFRYRRSEQALGPALTCLSLSKDPVAMWLQGDQGVLNLRLSHSTEKVE